MAVALDDGLEVKLGHFGDAATTSTILQALGRARGPCSVPLRTPTGMRDTIMQQAQRERPAREGAYTSSIGAAAP